MGLDELAEGLGAVRDPVALPDTTKENVSTTRPKTLRQLRQRHPEADLRQRRERARGRAVDRLLPVTDKPPVRHAGSMT